MKTDEHGMLFLSQQKLTRSSESVFRFFGWAALLGYGLETSRDIACGRVRKVRIGQLKLL